MSLKSSKKIVFSPATNSIGVVFMSGWPPAAGAAAAGGAALAEDCEGAGLDAAAAGAAALGAGVADGAGAAPPVFGGRLARSWPPLEFTVRPIVVPGSRSRAG